MNNTNIYINNTNVTFNFSLPNYNIPNQDIGIYYKNVCGQLNSYFIKMGLIIVGLYIFICWFNWWFFNYGYKKVSYNKNSKFGKYIGDLNILDTRIYWDIWIKDKLMKLMIGYIVVIIYLNI